MMNLLARPAGSLNSTRCIELLYLIYSVPDTPRPMVGYTLLPIGFHLFHRVVEEKIDEDGIDL